MLWIIEDEEYEFDNWEQLGIALRDLSRLKGRLSVESGELCDECSGEGEMIAFTSNGVNLTMECTACKGTGIKSFIS